MNKYVLEDDGKTPRVAKSSEEWSTRFERGRHVADDTIGDVRVSTVFLGLDHNFFEGPPILWETLVFGGSLDGEMDRYTSYDDAEDGHRKMVARVQETS